MSDDADWSEGLPDIPTIDLGIYVPKNQYDALAADLATEKQTRDMWQSDCLEADARIRELEALLEKKKEPIVYRQCAKHQGSQWSVTCTWSPPAREVCPNCEPPK